MPFPQNVDEKSQKYIFFPLDFGFFKQPTNELINIGGLIDKVINNKETAK